MTTLPETLACVGCQRPVRILDTLATQSGECACEACADAAKHRCAQCSAFELRDEATDGWDTLAGKRMCAVCMVARNAQRCVCCSSVVLMTTYDGQMRYIECERAHCWRGPAARNVAEAVFEWNIAMGRKAVAV